MQYETLFDISKAGAHGFGFIGLGFSIAVISLFLRYRLGQRLPLDWRWGFASGAVLLAQGSIAYVSSQQLIRRL